MFPCQDSASMLSFPPSESTETSFIYLNLLSQNNKSIKHEVQCPPLHPMSSQLGPGISYAFLTQSHM